MEKIVQKQIKHKKMFFRYAIMVCMSLFMGINQTYSLSNEEKAFAQQVNNAVVTINVKNRSINEALKQIQEQTSIEFVFSSPLKPSDMGNFTIVSRREPLKEVLDKLFNNTSYGYRLSGERIVIFKEEIQDIPADIKVQGKVIDEKGNPIAGATVLVEGTQIGAITNDDGSFSFEAKRGAKIVVSFVGYIEQTVIVNASNITIKLLPDELEVDDIVVTGMFRKSAETFTGSSVTVTAKELRQFGNRNVLTTLRNIDPSFNIIENNDFGSDPNAMPEITIRGTSSMPNIDGLQDDSRAGLNTPLIIIDGFESTLQRMMDMNENEISSITILKDAGATAMYGSRGANGVVVIETIEPEAGKLRITYRTDMNIEMPDLTSYSLLNSTDKLSYEVAAGVYETARAENQVELNKRYNHNLNLVNQGINTDWLSKPLRTGIGQRHNLRIEGGDEVFRYSASAQLNRIVGTMKESVRQNFNGDINLSYRVNNLRFSNRLSIGLNNTSSSPYGSFSEYALMNPYFAPYDADGNLVMAFGTNGNNGSLIWGSTGVANPLYNASLNTYSRTGNTLINNNFALDWNINEDLILRTKLGLSKDIGTSDTFYPSEHTMFMDYGAEDLLRKGEYTYKNDDYYSYDATLNLSYSKLLGEKHMIYAGANANIKETNSLAATFIAEGFSNEDMDMIAMALQYEEGGKPSGSESKNRSMGIVGNFNYSYDNRFFADFTLTGNGNSAFGSNNRFASFWSAGLGYNLHNESFIKDLENINKLKVRGSVGTSGSEAFSSYQALTTYRYFTDDRYFNWIGTDVNEIGNPDLKWQRKMNYNLGLELDMFNSRVSVILDTYIEKTSDQISSINLPTSTGFSTYIDNIGEVENRGYELKVTGQILRDTKKGLLWSISGAIAYNKNKIVSLSESMKEAQAEAEADKSSDVYTIYREGYSMNEIYVVPSLGIDPSTGREMFLDRNGNSTFTWSSLDLATAGVSTPDYRGNINSALRYKNLLFNVSFGYEFGGQVYNQTLINKVENVDPLYNVDSRVYNDRWMKPGDITQFKSVSDNSTTNKSSRFVEDFNMFRCQSISLDYELNNRFVKERLKFEHLSLRLSMDDLFYLSSVKRERGITYPFSRQLSLTLNITL